MNDARHGFLDYAGRDVAPLIWCIADAVATPR
jgi:hypothetical protein